MRETQLLCLQAAALREMQEHKHSHTESTLPRPWVCGNKVPVFHVPQRGRALAQGIHNCQGDLFLCIWRVMLRCHNYTLKIFKLGTGKQLQKKKGGGWKAINIVEDMGCSGMELTPVFATMGHHTHTTIKSRESNNNSTLICGDCIGCVSRYSWHHYSPFMLAFEGLIETGGKEIAEFVSLRFSPEKSPEKWAYKTRTSGRCSLIPRQKKGHLGSSWNKHCVALNQHRS